MPEDSLFDDDLPDVDRLTPGTHDPELLGVLGWFHRQDPDGRRVGGVLRESLDQVLDGPRTRRFRFAELRKTEKTHMGTIVEINLGKEFELDDGTVMDYRVGGVEVDCKYSMTLWGWQLPVESMGHLVLLLWADDDRSVWSAGLWRVDPAFLTQKAGNRDRKKALLASGRSKVTWLWQYQPLAENLLLHLPGPDVAAIFAAGSGQQRVNELFRRVQRRVVRREVVLTVAQQDDAPKRARDARLSRHLGREGIVVLGHEARHREVAAALNLPVPTKGEWVSVRVAEADPNWTGPSFQQNGLRWRIATKADDLVDAPVIPSSAGDID